MRTKLKSQLVVLLTVIVLSIASPTMSVAQVRASGVDVQTHKFRPSVAPGTIIPAVPAGVSNAATSGISASAKQQISALVADKKARTSAQKKTSSAVLYTARMLQGKPAAPGVDYLETGVEVDNHSNLLVDIHAEVSETLLSQLKGVGATVVTQSAKYHSIRALVPASQIETVASFHGVVFVGPKRESATNRAQDKNGSWRGSSFAVGFNERAAKIRNYVSAALATSSVTGTPAPTGQGSVTSEGDLAHRAFDARQAFGVNGTGLKIGVLSDGVTSLGLSQAAGDLPSDVTVLTGQTGDGDEGTAMLEIVHDLAPGAKLYFATAYDTPEQFAQNIRDLRDAGCDIIVDDVFYYSESPLHDGQVDPAISPWSAGVILQAVNDVTDDGAMYFSSAGNEGNVDSNTAGSYEGTFTDGGTSSVLPVGSGTLHNFGTTASPVLYDTISGSGGAYPFLFWADPLGTPTDDYDLYVLNSAGTAVLSASTDTQDGSGGQDPIEYIDASFDKLGNQLLVVKFEGNDVYFHLNTFRGQLAFSTSGETHGHSHAKNAYSVAATPAYSPYSATTVTGPWPNYFTTLNQIESFSSDGLRRIFFQPDGTPYTPGDFSSTGGIVRQKPDITAADGVSVTGVGGFGSPFYGTSASAPHAAAIAALVKSAKPSMTTDDMRTTLTGTAVDIMSTGTDRDSGAGIVMAFEAINSLGVPGTANPELGAITATDNPGNGNGYIEAGEGGVVSIQLKNTGGVVDATGITAKLSSATTGVAVTQPATSAYPNLAAGSGVATNASPFTFTLAPDYPCGQPIDFTLTVNYNSGPRALTFTLPTGPMVNVNTTLSATAPVVSGIVTTTGAQTGRISRSGVASTCATTPKTFPAYGSATGSREFNEYTFVATQNTCTTVTMTSPNGINLYTAAYSPTLTPGDVAVNFYADAGSSSSVQSFGMSTVAGQTYSVIVHDVPVLSAPSASAYNLQFSGCAFASLTPNHPPIAVAKDVSVNTITGTASASIDNGSYDPDGDAITITQSPAGPYSVGTTSVLLTVVDSKGATAQATASVTVVDVTPDLTVSSSHTGSFGSGQTGSYTLSVSNVGKGPTVSSVTLVDTLPSGLTATAISGSGWTCTLATVTCTRADALALGSSYPAITLTVSVSGTATTVVNQVTVSGGGDRSSGNNSASDSTTIVVPTISATPTQTAVNVLAGNSTTVNVGFAANINLTVPATVSCTIPTGMTLTTCTVAPSTINIGTSSTSVAVTLKTTGTATTQAAMNHEQWKYSSIFVAFMALPMIVFATPFVGRKRDRKSRVVLPIIGLVLLLAMLASCGGSSRPSTPDGIYAVKVSATSGTVTTSTTFNVTVSNLPH